MKQSEQSKEALRYTLRLAGILTAICVCVALIVAGVYTLTEEKYAENLAEEQRAAIAALFGSETVTTEELPATSGTESCVLYRVSDNGAEAGYCARVTSAGFGGDIEMMVAISPDEKLLGVRILSMSETPGVGVKATEEEYLAQYIGKSTGTALTGKQDVDFITGATISSRAVLAGVNDAILAVQNYKTQNHTQSGNGGDTQ